jgi:enoyl-CoA hydratase/carnithine racemase
MREIITEQDGSILRVQLNRASKRNAMTSAMYVALAAILDDASKNGRARVVLWHGAGDSFAGNDIEDFLKNPLGNREKRRGALSRLSVYGLYASVDRRRSCHP